MIFCFFYDKILTSRWVMVYYKGYVINNKFLEEQVITVLFGKYRSSNHNVMVYEDNLDYRNRPCLGEISNLVCDYDNLGKYRIAIEDKELINFFDKNHQLLKKEKIDSIINSVQKKLVFTYIVYELIKDIYRNI